MDDSNSRAEKGLMKLIDIVKGAAIGSFAAILLLTIDSGYYASIIAGSFVAIMIFLVGYKELGCGCVLSLVLVVVELIFQPIRGLVARLPIQENIAGGFAGTLVENFLVFTGVGIAGLLIAIIVMLFLPGPAPPFFSLILAGLGIIFGSILGIILWKITGSWLEPGICFIIAWGIGGGIVGFLYSLVPIPPMM